jgi:hypothetical protein
MIWALNPLIGLYIVGLCEELMRWDGSKNEFKNGF